MPLSSVTAEDRADTIRARNVISDILRQRDKSAQPFDLLPYVRRVYLLTWLMSNLTLLVTFGLPSSMMPAAFMAQCLAYFPISTIGLVLVFTLPPTRLYYVYALYCVGALLTLFLIDNSVLGPTYVTYFYGYLGSLFLTGAAIFPVFPSSVGMISLFYWLTACLVWWQFSFNPPNAHSSIFLFCALFAASLPAGIVHERIFNKMLVLGYEQNLRLRELTQINQLLEISLDQNQIGFLYFDKSGIVTLERGLSLETLFPDVKLPKTKLRGYVETLFQQSGVELKLSSDKAEYTKIGARILNISSKSFEDCTILTLFDVTEIHNIQSQLQRQQTLKVVGELASGIAHNYNNALGIALTQLHLIHRKNNDSELHAHISPALQALENSSELSRKLIALAGAKDLQLEVINLGECLQGISELLRSVTTAYISLKLTYDDELYIRTDKKALETAVLNLVLNAKAAMGGRQGTIHVFAKKTATTSGASVALTVRDNGQGIAKEIQHRIFDPFFTTKTDTHATGLGLTTVRKFVEDCEGEIEFESKHGVTDFTLTFPDASDEAHIGETTRRHVPPRKSLREVTANHMPMQQQGAVLLIDDNLQMLDSLNALVKAFDIKTYTANNFQKAISLLLHFDDISTVILDYSMPNIDGIELGRKLKSIKPHLRLVLISGNLPEEAKMRAKENGFVDVLEKPLSVNHIETILRAQNRTRPVSIH